MSSSALRTWLTGLWGGALLAISLIAVPLLFAQLDKHAAGQIAADYFTTESWLSLGFAVILLLLKLIKAKHSPAVLSKIVRLDSFLILFIILLTITNSAVIRPLMDSAKQMHQEHSFHQLHGLSMSLYMVKTICVLSLAWIYAKRQQSSVILFGR